MKRWVQPEILDGLPAANPRAVESRRDLRRLNSLMGNASALCAYVAERIPDNANIRMLEIGAGDGNISKQIAGRLGQRGITGHLQLMDFTVVPDARNSQTAPPPGWTVENVRLDVRAWKPIKDSQDVIVANLFLHHFETAPLRDLLAQCAAASPLFAAAEPRRNWFGAAAARCVGLIGCNQVTRHDAVVSVQAGFNGSELSALWPTATAWQVTECRSGLFTHFMGAARRR